MNDLSKYNILLKDRKAEVYSLQELAIIKNGKDYKTLSAGDVPVYGSGGVMTYVDSYSYNKPSVLIPRKGSLDKLYYVDGPFWNVDTIFYTEINNELILPKYLFYYLQNFRLQRLNNAGGVPSLTQGTLNKLKIPVPGLEYQKFVVNILDAFVELTNKLTNELTNELTVREQQLNYYRNFLILNRKKLSRVVNIVDVAIPKKGTRVTKSQLNNQSNSIYSFPVYQNSLNILGYYDKFNCYNTPFIIMAGSAGKIAFIKDKFWAADDCTYFECSSEINPKYLYHFLKTQQAYLNSQIRKASVPRISRKSIEKICIPLPEIDIQNEIVAILDKLETICTDLNEGIPAEIAARQKQYEYYRDKLLSFEELED